MPFLSLNAKALLNWVTSFKVMFQTVSLCIWYNYFKNILVWGVCDFQQQEHEKTDLLPEPLTTLLISMELQITEDLWDRFSWIMTETKYQIVT